VTGTTVTVMHEDGVARQYRRQAGGSYLVASGPSNGDTLTYDAVNGWDETQGATGLRFDFPAGNFVSLAHRATPLRLKR
jgi:hypothetical protein